MSQKQIRQHGTWQSPVSAKALSGEVRLSDVQWETDGDTLMWLEGRGAQGVLVAQEGLQAPRDLTGELSVRARVGYGGGDFTVAHDHVYFAGADDGRLYRQSLAGGGAQALTPGFGSAAAPRVSPDGKWLVYVYSYERKDGLAIIDAAGEFWPQKLASGTDFVMQPAWHPGGSQIAYIVWNHPNMPWDSTELRLLTLTQREGKLPEAAEMARIAGDETTAIFQPEFSPDGRYLAYVSDESGRGQLYLYDLNAQSHTQLTEGAVEHGAPAWTQGLRMYGWSADSRSIYYLRNEQGFYSAWRYDIAAGKPARMEGLEHYTALGQIVVSPKNGAIALLASSSTTPARVISHRAQSAAVVHRRSSSETLVAPDLAQAEAISWTGHDGGMVYGLYYPPANARFEGAGAPPLVIEVHGGPTSQRTAGYSAGVQFLTSRGFAVLQVNYRGSTGYGKAYMNKLRGTWGIYDVEDSASGGLYLAEQGRADREKLVIMGGSAGGFTVLQSLVDRPGFYKAGVSLYGVSNQFLLAQDTHKFEERYLDSLLGPLPQAAEIYRARSPYYHAEKIVDPLIVFQGADDLVVPQNQSDLIIESLRARGVPHEYHIYTGEGHGFRRPETIEHYHDALLKFLMQHVVYA